MSRINPLNNLPVTRRLDDTLRIDDPDLSVGIEPEGVVSFQFDHWVNPMKPIRTHRYEPVNQLMNE